jgi:anti-sigma regulatory factor (Ser/Thr protein kinase)
MACALPLLLDGGLQLVITSRLPCTVASVSAARQTVALALAGFAVEHVEVAQLLTSELVTNAVLHSGGSLQLQVELGLQGCRITVQDSSSQLPSRRDAGSDAEDGRGLALVDGLASSWGCRRFGPGKQVWFELPATKPAADGCVH